MSKPNNGPSLFVIVLNVIAVFITGGYWLIPLGLYYISKAVHGRKPSLLTVAANTFMTTITGGLWLIPLGIYYLMKKK